MSQSGSLVPALSPIADPLSAFSSCLAGAAVPTLPNTILVEQGQSPPFVHLIRSGIVKISFTDEHGSETTLGLRSQGWWVGGTSTLVGLPSLYRITTLTACELSSITSEQFLTVLLRNQRMLRHFLSSQCRELLTTQHHAMLQGSSFSKRLHLLAGDQKGLSDGNAAGQGAEFSVPCAGRLSRLR